MAIKFTCGYCNVRSIGRVSKAVNKVIDDLNSIPYCLLICDNCSNCSLFSFSLNTGYIHEFAGFEDDNNVIAADSFYDANLLPKTNSRIPKFLPNLLKNIFEDAEQNFIEKRWKTAAQLYLQAIEFACILIEVNGDEEKAASSSSQKLDLTKRINDLFRDGLITNSLKEWAHQIRTIGQYHKHRYLDTEANECSDLRDFSEMFLRYTFSIPGQIESRRADQKTKKD